jgi:hypothetical protein
MRKLLLYSAVSLSFIGGALALDGCIEPKEFVWHGDIPRDSQDVKTEDGNGDFLAPDTEPDSALPPVEGLINIGGLGYIQDKVQVNFEPDSGIESLVDGWFGPDEFFANETTADKLEEGKYGISESTLDKLPGWYNVKAFASDGKREYFGDGQVTLLFPYVNAMSYDWQDFVSVSGEGDPVKPESPITKMQISDLEIILGFVEQELGSTADVTKLKGYLGAEEDSVAELRASKMYGDVRLTKKGFIFEVVNAGDVYFAEGPVYEHVELETSTIQSIEEIIEI